MRAGIFVGGRGTRMGGVAKGLLVGADGVPLVVRAARILAGLGIPPVLVGAHEAYQDLGLTMLADDPGAKGPLAGLLSLLSGGDALAIACDMPAFTTQAIQRLLAAPPASVVAPRRHARDLGREVWEPLFARYSATVLPAAQAFATRGERRLQRLLDEVGAAPLALGPDEDAWLLDWDHPSDVPSLLDSASREKDKA